jgi:hypothetical protein
LIPVAGLTIYRVDVDDDYRYDGAAWAVVAGGGVSDGDKGDVTVSGGGATWTIDSDAVSYAKMQNVSAASRLIGRGSAAGAGDPQELTLGAGLAMSGTVVLAATSVDENGVNVGSRPEINFDDSTSIEFSVSDDIPNARVNITATRPALTGDVTASANSNATTIASSAVTTAKIADDAVTDDKLRNSAAVSVIGRSANSSGGPADIAASANGDSLERYNNTAVFQSHAGTSFPASPYNGMRFIRTDLDYEEFLYDGGRSIWRSTRPFELAFTNQATVSAGANFRLFQGPVGTTTAGYLTKWSCVVTEISAMRLTSGANATADLYAGASIVTGASITVGSGVITAVSTGLNVAVSSGVVLNAIANAGGAWTGGGHVIWTLHRTAT